MPVVGEPLIDVSFLSDRIVQPFTEVSSTKASTTCAPSISIQQRVFSLPPPVLLGLPQRPTPLPPHHRITKRQHKEQTIHPRVEV
ncbi:hypothetical protein BYT27DRAFT_6430891 [Phlegmacium glaucopus]|nr:hypothetical protein BYT27DRAFT_6430891 [Phlegmacium glaucopus]